MNLHTLLKFVLVARLLGELSKKRGSTGPSATMIFKGWCKARSGKSQAPNDASRVQGQGLEETSYD